MKQQERERLRLSNLKVDGETVTVEYTYPGSVSSTGLRKIRVVFEPAEDSAERIDRFVRGIGECLADYLKREKPSSASGIR